MEARTIMTMTPDRGRDGLRDAIEALAEASIRNGRGGTWVHDAWFAAVLAEHPATGDEERAHHQSGDECDPRCPATFPHHTTAEPDAGDVDSDNAAAGGAEGLAEVEALAAMLVTAGFDQDGDDKALARTVLTSDWLAAHVAQAKADERERIAQAIEATRITCPDHGIPDCSPLLNGCSAPIRLNARRAEDARIARGES
jgi:hypothetical protein